MSKSHVTAIERTLNKTHHWLEEIRVEMGWEDQEKAYDVLHALRDRMLPDEAVQLAAQLPTLVRGCYFAGWHPADKPLKYRDKQTFLARVQQGAPNITNDELELTVTAVFHRLSTEIPGGETDQVRDQLPADVRELWARSAL